MKVIEMVKVERRYKNNGQEAERIFSLSLLGLDRKADNIPCTVSGDVLGYQVKSSKATVCKGVDIDAHIAKDVATAYAYILEDFSKAVIMTPSEYAEFAKAFAYVTKESTSNGGAVKMRLKKESKAMRAYLLRQARTAHRHIDKNISITEYRYIDIDKTDIDMRISISEAQLGGGRSRHRAGKLSYKLS